MSRLITTDESLWPDLVNRAAIHQIALQSHRRQTMCRSIKQLRSSEVPATPEEIEAAARQFVRKINLGFRAGRFGRLC